MNEEEKASKALINMGWIRNPEKTHPGSRGQKGTGSRIRNTGLGYSG